MNVMHFEWLRSVQFEFWIIVHNKIPFFCKQFLQFVWHWRFTIANLKHLLLQPARLVHSWFNWPRISKTLLKTFTLELHHYSLETRSCSNLHKSYHARWHRIWAILQSIQLMRHTPTHLTLELDEFKTKFINLQWNDTHNTHGQLKSKSHFQTLSLELPNLNLGVLFFLYFSVTDFAIAWQTKCTNGLLRSITNRNPKTGGQLCEPHLIIFCCAIVP